MASASPVDQTATVRRPAAWSRLTSGLTLSSIGPLLALLLAAAYFTTRTDRFLTGPNLSLVVQQSMVVGVLAIGQTLIILTAGIDLSCGAVMALGGIVMTREVVNHGVNPYLAILIGFGVCVGFGLLNGLLITFMRLPPFIVTLGTLNIAFALTHIYSHESTVVDVPNAQLWLGRVFRINHTRITYGMVLLFVLFILTWFVLSQSALGRHIYAIGNNPEAARLTGISTYRLLIIVYTLAGLFYGIAALLLVARTGVGDPNAGQTDNLSSITAVVLGGTSLFGGRGTIIGSLIGVLIVGIFRNGLQLTGVNAVYQVLITGILVILAVTVDQFARRKQA
jgi:fructose transport system permease protein